MVGQTRGVSVLEWVAWAAAAYLRLCCRYSRLTRAMSSYRLDNVYYIPSRIPRLCSLCLTWPWFLSLVSLVQRFINVCQSNASVLQWPGSSIGILSVHGGGCFAGSGVQHLHFSTLSM